MVKPVWNNAQRVNHQNFAKKNMVPRSVLMKCGLVSINTDRKNISKTAVLVNTARQVNTTHSKTTVNAARPMSYLSKTAHSTVKRPIHKNTSFKNSNINQRVNTVRDKKFNTVRPKVVVNVVKGNNLNVVKASACWVWKPKHKVLDHGNPQMDLQDKGVIDSGCLRYMTGNMSYLTDYEEIDGGYVSFGGNPKGGKITRKCTIKTSKLDFENVYFVRELKFNLFSVSQMCDKKNSVLFNDTEYIVLSPNFKLIDESQVLLRVPRKNNMYSVDLKNIVPKGGLTCLFAKVTSDESKLWHRRLGHLNFKTMNKLVKGNLVRGLPSKLFENDQTCVACQKGKQHRASCCSKHMTGNRSKLKNFVEKFIGSVRFGNDHFGAIMGYGDYVIGDSVISRVYYVEGLGHNLFSVGQFCDSDLEVAFRKHSCFVRDINGADLLKGSRRTNLYTISIDDMMKSSPICLLSKASKSKSWLWHRRLNHLNFGTINDLARKDLVRGLPRLKFEKDHLCSACQLGKSKKFSHKPKSENTNMEVLHTLHMDLCGPMRVQSINGKKYILVIVDDYSRFTWVKFLRSKDETPEFVINFLKQIQVGLNKTVRYIRTDNGTEFVNQVMSKYYEGVGIFHQKSVPRTPQQNGVVERRNRTLVEAARTMLIFSKAPMFLWAEAVATACYTQNRSLIHTRHNKTPYELVHDKKPDLTFLRVFGALCYPTNDSEDLGKFQAKANIGIFVGYAPSRKGYRIYNKRTRRLMEIIHVTFDEMYQTMAPVRISLGPEPIMMTPGQLSSGLAPSPVPATTYIPPTDKDLEILFQPMFNEYFDQSTDGEPVPTATVVNAPIVSTNTSVSTTIAQDAPSTSHSLSSSQVHPLVFPQGVAAGPTIEDTLITQADLHPSVNPVAGEPSSA
ncbi:retrovirus-related pol polyprotein from transposon TNT 1-94 [Tanacetum coccineum]